MRSHAPVGRARGNNLDKRIANAVDLVLEGLLDGALGVAHVLRGVNADTLEIRRAVKRAQQLAYANRIACGIDIATVG